MILSPSTQAAVVGAPGVEATEAEAFLAAGTFGAALRASPEFAGLMAAERTLSADAEAALSAAPDAYRWWRTSWVTWRAQRARMLTALPTALPVTLVRTLGREVTDLDVVRELGSVLVEGAVLAEEDDGPVGDV